MSPEMTTLSNAPKPPPPLAHDAHKGIAGRVLCLAGSETMPGAALLVARAAQRAGAGLVTLATFDRNVIYPAAVAVPEAIYIDLSRSKDLIAGRLPAQLVGRGDHARVAGPGLGRGGRTDELIRRVVEDDFDGPLVLDADGLNIIGATPEVLAQCRGPLVLTPHHGEASRLLGRDRIPSADAERIEVAQQLARSSSGICVLKGHHTVVTDGEQTFVNPTGNPAMATAGSGDVLSGILGAYLAYSHELQSSDWNVFEAVCSGVYMHGLAGDIAVETLGERAVTASVLIDHLGVAQLQHQRAPRG